MFRCKEILVVGVTPALAVHCTLLRVGVVAFVEEEE